MIVNKSVYYIFRNNETIFIKLTNDLSVIVRLKNQKFITIHPNRLLKLKL